MSTAALIKKGIKERCHNKIDFEKLREDLRQRCKHRMREQREALFNQRRFGVSTEVDVQNKIKEIFHTELNDLATKQDYNIPEGATELIQKLVDNKELEKTISDEEKVIVEEYFKFKEEETSTLLKEES